MKIMVGVKRVIDHNVRIRVKVDGSGVERANVKMAINPFDEIAVEQAVRLKEAGQVSEVVVVSIGDSHSQETLRSALALGADRAILIESPQAAMLDSLDIARLLKHIAQQEQSQLILLGKQAIDDDCNQTGQMLAALLNCSQATCASEICILDAQHLQVSREIDGGQETLVLQQPAVVTADLRLNEPRYATLPNIMKAKKKPLEIVPLIELDFMPLGQVKTLNIAEPTKRTAGCKFFASASELVDVLKTQKAI